jgi:hypothetical protein
MGSRPPELQQPQHGQAKALEKREREKKRIPISGLGQRVRVGYCVVAGPVRYATSQRETAEWGAKWDEGMRVRKMKWVRKAARKLCSPPTPKYKTEVETKITANENESQIAKETRRQGQIQKGHSKRRKQ